MIRKTDNRHDKLTSGSLLARNTAWNLAGQVAPLLSALIAFPLLITYLGTERFGVLTLIWVVIGYFGLFDLGLRRALTKLIAEKLGSGMESEVPSLIWTSVAVMFAIGSAASLAMLLIAAWLVHSVLNIPEGLQQETLKAFYLVAGSIVVVVCAAGLRGSLEAYQRFGLVNLVRAPMGVLTFVGPLLVLYFTRDLFFIALFLVLVRLLTLLAYLFLNFQVVPELGKKIKVRPDFIRPLVFFGGWVAISNITGPLMAYLDRFMVAALLSVAAVAYYSTPYEFVSSMSIVPAALATVLFPAFSTSFESDRERTRRLFVIGVKYVFLVLFPVTLLIVTFASDGLELWLGAEFAQNSAFVLKMFAIGRLIISLAQLPLALVQGVGRPDLPAKLHLVELPLFFGATWWAISVYGIKGGAVVWVGRALIETAMLFSFSRTLLRLSWASVTRGFIMIGAFLAVLLVAAVDKGALQSIVYLVVVTAVFSVIAWRSMIDKDSLRTAMSFFSSQGKDD